jgi:hypothetical protein
MNLEAKPKNVSDLFHKFIYGATDAGVGAWNCESPHLPDEDRALGKITQLRRDRDRERATVYRIESEDAVFFFIFRKLFPSGWGAPAEGLFYRALPGEISVLGKVKPVFRISMESDGNRQAQISYFNFADLLKDIHDVVMELEGRLLRGRDGSYASGHNRHLINQIVASFRGFSETARNKEIILNRVGAEVLADLTNLTEQRLSKRKPPAHAKPRADGKVKISAFGLNLVAQEIASDFVKNNASLFASPRDFHYQRYAARGDNLKTLIAEASTHPLFIKASTEIRNRYYGVSKAHLKSLATGVVFALVRASGLSNMGPGYYGHLLAEAVRLDTIHIDREACSITTSQWVNHGHAEARTLRRCLVRFIRSAATKTTCGAYSVSKMNAAPIFPSSVNIIGVGCHRFLQDELLSWAADHEAASIAAGHEEKINED